MKYRHRGYRDDDSREDRPPAETSQRPRRDPDLPGGRLAEPQRALRRMKCHRCGHVLPLEHDSRGDVLPVSHDAACGGCGAAVHACRNCIHFDPDAHLECRKPVKVRLKKDAANDCELFEPRVVVEMTRDQGRPEAQPSAPSAAGTRTVSNARKAFEDLFK